MHMILHDALVNQACAQKHELSHHMHLWSSQKTAVQAWNQIIIYLSIQKSYARLLSYRFKAAKYLTLSFFSETLRQEDQRCCKPQVLKVLLFYD